MEEDDRIFVGSLLKKQEEVLGDFGFTDPYHAIMLMFMLSQYDYLEHTERDQGYLITERLLEDFPLISEFTVEHEAFSHLVDTMNCDEYAVEILFRSGTWWYQQEFVALDLADLLISDISPDVFVNFPKLKHIKLNHNLLGSLPDTLFSSLKDLQSLNLSNNLISQLPLHIFSQNTKLQHLNLAHNGIDYRWLQKFNVVNRLTHQQLEIKL